MINKQLTNILRSDLLRYSKKTDKLLFLKSILFYPGFRFSFFFRLASFYNNQRLLSFFLKIIVRHYTYKYGFQIKPGTSIGKGLYIGHFGNLIVNKNSIIGENCNLSPGVVIGQTNRGLNKGCPIIGNKVWVGSNSVIVGKITIGNNVLIAPLSYVNINIPDNSIVIGNPAQVIHSINATDNYIENILV